MPVGLSGAWIRCGGNRHCRLCGLLEMATVINELDVANGSYHPTRDDAARDVKQDVRQQKPARGDAEPHERVFLALLDLFLRVIYPFRHTFLHILLTAKKMHANTTTFQTSRIVQKMPLT